MYGRKSGTQGNFSNKRAQITYFDGTHDIWCVDCFDGAGALLSSSKSIEPPKTAHFVANHEPLITVFNPFSPELRVEATVHPAPTVFTIHTRQNPGQINEFYRHQMTHIVKYLDGRRSKNVHMGICCTDLHGLRWGQMIRSSLKICQKMRPLVFIVPIMCVGMA